MNYLIVGILLALIIIYTQNIEMFTNENSLFYPSRNSSSGNSTNYKTVYLTNPDPNFLFNGSVTILEQGKQTRYIYSFNLPNIDGSDFNRNENKYIASIGHSKKMHNFAYLQRDQTGSYRAEITGSKYNSFSVILQKTGQTILSGYL